MDPTGGVDPSTAVPRTGPGRALHRLDAAVDRRWPAVAVGLVALHLGLVARFAASNGGVVVTPDGTRYLERADALGRGDLAFATVTWRPLHFPPLYPGLLALVDHLTPLTARGAAIACNAVAVVAVVWGLDRLGGLVFARAGRPLGWRLLLPLSFLLWSDVVAVGGAVLSDLPFFALWVWLLVATLELVRTRRPAWVATAAGLAGAAVLLRYAAAFLVVGVVLALALEARGRVARLRAAAAVALAGAVPTVAWYLWARPRVPSTGTAHGQVGHLGLAATAVDSLVSFGSALLGVEQVRIGGYRGRSTFETPILAHQLPAFAVLAAAAMATALAGAAWTNRRWRAGPGDDAGTVAPRLLPAATAAAQAAEAPHRPPPGSGHLAEHPAPPPEAAPGSLRRETAILLVLVPTLVYLGLLHLYRARSGLFVIQRYLGLAPTACWLALAAATGRRRAVPAVTIALVTATIVGLWGLALRLD